jgi:hypothetical protein
VKSSDCESPIASTTTSVAARDAVPSFSTRAVLLSSPSTRTSPSDPNKGQLRSASSFVQSMTGSNVGRRARDFSRTSSNGATRLTHSGASDASCRSSASADRASSSRSNAPRKVDVEIPNALAPTVPSKPKPHAPPSVMRASPSPIVVETFATSARSRERQQRGRGDRAESDQTPQLRARVASAAQRLRVAPVPVDEPALADAAARDGVSERRRPVRGGRLRASAHEPLLRVAKRRRRDDAAEKRRALQTRRRASSCHRETRGGSHARALPNG